MKFAQTHMLYLIWLVPLGAALFWYGHRSRQRILKRFAKPPGLAVILPPALPRRGIRAILILIVFLLLAVALSGPQYGYRWQAVERRGVDLVIALDCSRSMLAEDITPSRLDRAKREIVDLLKMLAGDRVGLVAFAGTAFLQCPLTVDYEAFHLFLQHLGPDFLPVGGTDLAAALTVATESFDPETATDKAVILITDGGHTGSADLQAAVDAAKNAKVKLFCIGVGGESGVPVPAAKGGFKKDRGGKIVLSRLDETGLKQMALATGGGYVRSVAGDMDLDAVYHQQIRKEMRAQTLTASRRQVWEDRYQWALGFALALLVLEMLLPAAARGRVARDRTARGRTARGRVARGRATALKVIPVMILCGGLLLPQTGRAADAKKAVEAYEAGEYEAALKGFIDAQLDDPDNPEVLYNVGNAYYKNGDYAAAGQHYKDALDKLGSPEENADLAARLHYNLGNAQFRAGQYPQSVESYERSIQLSPDDSQAQENLAFVKKVMDQPPPPQQPNQGQEGDQEADQKDPAGDSDPSGGEDRSQGESGNRDQQGQSSGDQKEEDEGERSSFGKEMAEDKSENNDPKASDTSPPGADGNQDQAASQGADQAAGGIDPQLAEQMLNRLEDKPGRALMPAYQGREVEEDW